MTSERASMEVGELARELSRLHELLAEERRAPEDVRRVLHRLLFMRALELADVPIEEAPLLDELVGDLERPAVQRALARLRDPDGPWTEATLTAAGLGAAHEIYLATVGEHGSDAGGSGERKRLGAYYTPDTLVEHLVGQALGRLMGPPTTMPRGELADWALLDPACGGGRFLMEALSRLLKWYRGAWQADHLTGPERLSIARHHIYGLDIDPLAVDATRLALAAALSGGARPTPVHPRELERNVVVGDALQLGVAEPERQLPLDVEIAAPEPKLPATEMEALEAILGRGGFDLVIGNPPYVSFSGRQAQIRPDSLGRRRRASKGWPALHALFVEHAVERLSRRLVAFVVPDQLGHLDSYGPAREAVTRHAGLVDVRYWGEDVFPGVVSPILTFVADRRYSGRAAIELRDGALARRRIAGGARWHATGSDRLVARMLERGESLGHLVSDPGVHTGNCAAKLIVPADGAPPGTVPVLEGRLVDRYSCKPPRKRLRLDYEPAEGEYFRIGGAGRYAAAAFLIRQTAAFPIVGPRVGAVYFRNSLLALSEPDGVDVRFVVGLLNSSLMRSLYRLLVPESGQRAFPQVKVSSLRKLPIKRLDRASAADRRRHDRVVALVDRLLELGPPEAMPAEAERAACDAELDALVFELYGVTDAERRALAASDPLLAASATREAA